MLVSVSIVPEVVHGKELRKVNSGESIEEHENASEKDRLDKLGKDTRLAVIMLSTESLYIELVVRSSQPLERLLRFLYLSRIYQVTWSLQCVLHSDHHHERSGNTDKC